MKYYGINASDDFFVEISGRIWKGTTGGHKVEHWSNSPCSCCVPGWMKLEMEKDGVVFWKDGIAEGSSSFYHDGANPPSEEEWKEALDLHHGKTKQERMKKFKYRVMCLLREYRFADARTLCEEVGLNIGEIIREHEELVV